MFWFEDEAAVRRAVQFQHAMFLHLALKLLDLLATVRFAVVEPPLQQFGLQRGIEPRRLRRSQERQLPAPGSACSQGGTHLNAPPIPPLPDRRNATAIRRLYGPIPCCAPDRRQRPGRRVCELVRIANREFRELVACERVANQAYPFDLHRIQKSPDIFNQRGMS